jgi:hypothetical protein
MVSTIFQIPTKPLYVAPKKETVLSREHVFRHSPLLATLHYCAPQANCTYALPHKGARLSTTIRALLPLFGRGDGHCQRNIALMDGIMIVMVLQILTTQIALPRGLPTT